MSGHYIEVDGKPVPEHDLLTWARWYDKADRRVELTKISKDISVSTVFLGNDHQYGDGPPLLYETMIFGGKLDQDCDRYSTREQAVAGHAAMVERAMIEYKRIKGAK